MSGAHCQVTDLGAVLHMVGGTAASYMIFFLPGLLLVNAAIVKHSASSQNLAARGSQVRRLLAPGCRCMQGASLHGWRVPPQLLLHAGVAKERLRGPACGNWFA